MSFEYSLRFLKKMSNSGVLTLLAAEYLRTPFIYILYFIGSFNQISTAKYSINMKKMKKNHIFFKNSTSGCQQTGEKREILLKML